MVEATRLQQQLLLIGDIPTNISASKTLGRSVLSRACQEQGARNKAGSQGLWTLLAPHKKGNVLPASGRVLQDKSFVSFQIISGFQTLCTEIEAKWHLRTTDWTVNWRLKQLVWESVAGKHIWSRRKISCSYPPPTFFQMLLEDELAQQIRGKWCLSITGCCSKFSPV